MRLSFEDIRFDSIKEVNFSQQAFVASVKFFFAGRELQFRSWYRSELRMLSQLVQYKMFEATEKRHYKMPDLQVGHSQKTLQEQVQPIKNDLITTSQISHSQHQAGYKSSPQLEQYLNERIARWRRASRFIDNLTMATKTGRQVLDLETSKR